MTTQILPITRLISVADKLQYSSKKCCYSTCSSEPITSHTISENYLYKLNNDLTEVLTFQRKLLRIVTNSSSPLVPINKEEFSTFVGFCPTHDNKLFGLIDSFDGKINKEKAALVHYRNICFGINHIRTQQLREQHISQQNYIKDKSSDIDDENVLNLLKNGALANRLDYCLAQHLLRKKQLENMIRSGNFDDMNFLELCGSLDNPIFCGRSTNLLHKHNLFNYPGYSCMPWITYMTLVTNQTNHLVFCWLKSDEKHARYLKNLIKRKVPKEIIAMLAYACSDALAVEKSFHSRNSSVIDETIKGFRVY